MELIFFHYHLRAGGVGSVIRYAVEALGSGAERIEKIRVVTGSSEGKTHFGDVAGAGVTVVPEIGYGVPSVSPRDLSALLLERFGSRDAVWWIHNHHLGKNPVFTQALLETAQSAGAPRMVLQPHDFPEAGRFDNLAALARYCTLPLYPVGPRIRYAVINRRDFDILHASGIPESDLFLLENPVPTPEGTTAGSPDRRAARKLLFPDIESDALILLYPVRAIRRKNVLEAGLITLLSGPKARLLVTLPGVSVQEEGYSRMVRDAFESGIIPGRFGIGAEPAGIPLNVTAAASDLVVSSSMQEGFGYAYFQALQWGFPLLARRLDTLEGMSGVFSGYPAVFYSGVSCAPHKRERKRLKALYGVKLRRLASVLPSDAIGNIERNLAGMLENELVDFSFLDPSAQMGILKEASESGHALSGLREINHELVWNIETLRSAHPRPAVERMEERFGPEVFAGGLRRIVKSFERTEASPAAVSPREIESRVRRAFSTAASMRLLYD